MIVIKNISKLLTLEGVRRKSGRHIKPEDLNVINDGVLIVDGNGAKCRVVWAGAKDEIPSEISKLLKKKSAKTIDARGRMVMPGLIDSHTHLVFAGDRSHEFEMRLAGKTYQEIAASGGGIVNTMTATRMASYKDLLASSRERLENFLAQGVTTVEIKTGYGLDYESELKCLKVIAELKKSSKATVRSTFLAAHAVPPEFKNHRQEYIQVIAHEWLPKLKKYSDFVDIFLDEGYFDREDAAILLSEAQQLKIPIKLHADELKLTGGTETAVNFGALSADHLLKITDNEIKLLKNSEVTATLLPTTAFFLKTESAPARKLLDGGARVALATDFNPGTSPTQDISLVGLLAALNMKMRTEEIIAGLTVNAAFALGLQDHKGALMPGYDADFLMFEAQSPAQIFYQFGQRILTVEVFSQGQFI